MENENTGTGQAVIAGESASATTVEPSPRSQSGDKNSTSSARKNASVEEKNEAVSTIAGAMLICKDFGVRVDYANVDDDLVLIIRKTHAVPQDSGKLAFRYIGA